MLLHEVEGPVNLGSVCRAMANTGFHRLRFSGCLRKDDPDARKFAVHAAVLLDKARKCDALEELIAGLDMVFGFTPRHPWQDGRDLGLSAFCRYYYRALAQGKRIGLLFGNEARGLTNQHLAHCHFRVTIPAHETYVSMNLAQAVLVVLWELVRGGDRHELPGEVPPEMASAEEKEILLDKIRDYLDVLELLNPQNPEHLWMEIMPIFRARDWTKRELTLLQGIFGKGQSRYLAMKKKAMVNDKAEET